jgi:nucleoside-diphosphate-sugar epimerase
VEDAVDAYLAIGASLDDPAMRGRAWNAGWGKPIPVIDVVRTLISVSGVDVEPDVQGSGTPHGEIDRQYLDSTAIREQIGWEPKWDLERGLAAAWEWYRQQVEPA